MDVTFESRDGVQVVTLPLEDYERLLELVEDRADIRASAAAEERRLAGEEYLPGMMADRLLAGESPLRLWREHRGLSIAALAASVEIGRSYLSEIERGLKPGTPRLWRKLAAALDVELDDIVPDAD